jgi:hypothetical protein
LHITFFLGEKQESDGMVVLMDYREDGITPYFWYIKDGILEEKYVVSMYCNCLNCLFQE